MTIAITYDHQDLTSRLQEDPRVFQLEAPDGMEAIALERAVQSLRLVNVRSRYVQNGWFFQFTNSNGAKWDRRKSIKYRLKREADTALARFNFQLLKSKESLE